MQVPAKEAHSKDKTPTMKITNSSAWRDYPVERIVNPTPAALRLMAKKYTGTLLETSFSNLNKVSRNKARMAKFTYVIAESTEGLSHQHRSERAAQLIEAQAQYILKKGALIEIEATRRAVPVSIYMEGATCRMQQVYPSQRGCRDGRPTAHIFGYTPQISGRTFQGSSVFSSI